MGNIMQRMFKRRVSARGWLPQEQVPAVCVRFESCRKQPHCRELYRELCTRLVDQKLQEHQGCKSVLSERSNVDLPEGSLCFLDEYPLWALG